MAGHEPIVMRSIGGVGGLYYFQAGPSGFGLAPARLRAERWLRFELYMRQKGMPPKQAFRALEADRAAIERELGIQLDWQELPPERRASRIATYLDNASVDDRADWARQQRWNSTSYERSG